MSTMSDVFLCGGDCVEDVNGSEYHLQESPEIFGVFRRFCVFLHFFDGFGLIFRHPLAYLHFDNLRGDVACFCFAVCLNHFVACRNRFVVRFFRFVVCR